MQLSLRRRSDPEDGGVAEPAQTGHSLLPQKFQVWILIALTALAVGGAGFVVATATHAGQDDPKTLFLHLSAQAVRTVIRSDLQPSFAPAEETIVEDLGNGSYKVTGWVDLFAEEGAGERQNFSCILFQNEAGDWAAKNVSMIPQ